MNTFKQICKAFEEMDVVSYSVVLAEKAKDILPALHAITGDAVSGVGAFATFIMGAIAADGRLAEEEYAICEPALKLFFGDEVDYETCRKTVLQLSAATRELKKCVDDMVDILGELSDELKSDIILVCLMFCAVDGKVSAKEKRWIKQLIRE